MVSEHGPLPQILPLLHFVLERVPFSFAVVLQDYMQSVTMVAFLGFVPSFRL